MTHLTEEELVLYYYGEVDDRAGAAAHLDACPPCGRAYAALSQVLTAIEPPAVPEPRVGFERDMWRRLAPIVTRETRPTWWSRFRQLLAPAGVDLRGPRLALAGAVTALVVLAFAAGRLSNAPADAPQQAAGPGRDRILLIAVGDHLERSQMVLVEIVNAGADGPVDISATQEGADDLVAANRLYRQAAVQAGDGPVADVLEDLEHVLMEIAHAPSHLQADALDAIRQRIESQGLLFKIRVIESRAREGRAGV
jgi:hypothetical protein